MASTTSERLHRISGEAINRLRNDHEQFLEAYEKPTQIYRFLKARHSLKPLFLHRNLSYMRRRGSSKRRKRLKKLRVDDLLKHTRDQKPDLATEIKSDNYLQINFSCLEKGIDFNELLEAASSDSTKSQTNDKKSSDETEGGAGRHENHQLEVEVMLYRFKQPVAETLMEAPKVCPYSHSSLGKFVLEYQHDSNSSSLSSVTSASKLTCKKSNSTINSVSTSSGHDLTLSIPESELTWKGGSRSTGTQMLVFRASQHVAGASRNSLRKRARLPSSSKKPGRKTVALELNRINPAKFQSQAATAPSMAVHDQWVADSSNKGGRPSSSGAVVETQSNRRKSSSSSVENSGSTAKIVHVNGHNSSITTNEASVKSSSEMNWSDCNHNQEEANSSVRSSSEAKNSGAARTKGVFKKTETREIGVMTDLCGIDSMLDLSSVGSNSLPTNRKASSNLRLSLQPCPSLKKGCTDRCTSPGFPSKSQAFRNGGVVNGFTFNGYANPDVLMLRAGPGVYQQKRKKKAALSLLQNHYTEDKQASDHECLLDLERNGGEEEAVMTHTDPETGEIRPRGEFQAVTGSEGGGGGELPFKVSIPRTVLNSSSNDDDSHNDGGVVEPTADSAGSGAAVIIGGGGLEGEVVGSMPAALTSSNNANKKGSTQSSSTVSGGVHPLQKSPSAYKRRSEVQLLLDGDKPPSERLSASEVPIFTAEDVSSRNSRNTGRGSGSGTGGQLSNKSWLDSSTRKITPVDHFDYAFVSLTEKVTGIVHSSSNSSGGGGAGGGATSGVSNSTASSRKRNISDSDGGNPAATTLSSGKGGGSGAVPPPTKQAKIVNNGRANSSSAVNVEENCKLDGVDSSSENSAALLSPTAGSMVTQDTPTADISKAAIASYGSNSSLESVSDSLGIAKAGNSSDGGLVDKNSLFHPDDVFASELVVFDSRGDCLLQEGEYSILMQRCSKKESTARDVPELLTFPPLTWSSVFASGGTNSKKSENSQFQNIMLRFSLCWTHGPPKHRLCSEFDTALDLQKIREAYFPPRSPTPPPLSLPPSLPLPHPPPSTIVDQEVTSSSSSFEMDRMSDTSPVPPPAAQCSSKEPIDDFEEETAMMEEDEEEEGPPSVETMDLTSSYILLSPPPPPHAPPLAPPPPTGAGGTGTCLLPPSRPDSSSSSISNRDKLVFNFLYNNSTLQQTESQGEMRCPWCFLCCERLYSLLKHMSLNHPRFHYTYTPSESGPSVVDVHVNKMYDAGSSILERDPGERRDILQRRRGPNKRIPCTALLVERHAEVDEDLSEFLNDGSWKRGYIANRIYHHSRSSLPMLPEEIENESEEDEHSLEWQITSSQKMIDEFTDVNKGEKELMKLWNTFSMQNKLIAAKQIPAACLSFACEKKEELIEKGIVQNFMTHLIALCDIGLINPTVLKDSMTAVYTTSTTS